MGGMMGGFGTGFGGAIGGLGLFGSLISMVLTIGLLAGLVLLGMWLWRQFGGAMTTPVRETTTASAHEILQARYARGELTRDQFRSMLQDLN